MATIAFFSYNLTLGCIFGSYGVLIGAIEAKLGVSRDVSSLGIPLVLMAVALMAPVVGVLSSKISIRFLLIMGTLMLAVGFVLLAVGRSVTLFLAVYALLIGPAMSLNMTMLPTTLVTRWYNVNRGRTLGIVTMPLLSAVMSPLVALVLTDYGLSVTYLMLAAVAVLLLPALFFVIDYPPSGADPTGEDLAAESTAHPGMSISELLRTRSFWTLTVGFAAVMTGAAVLAAHVVPIAMGWGFGATKAATLLSFSSIGGIAGSAAFGWVADRLGGAQTLAILCIGGAILWALVLLQPPYPAMAMIVGLMGFTGAPVVVAASVALSQRFGPASFARAFGLCNLMNLPFMVLGVPAVAHVYVVTGSYAGAIIGLMGFFLVGAICALTGRVARLVVAWPPPTQI
jgi:cyanate permease